MEEFLADLLTWILGGFVASAMGRFYLFIKYWKKTRREEVLYTQFAGSYINAGIRFFLLLFATTSILGIATVIVIAYYHTAK